MVYYTILVVVALASNSYLFTIMKYQNAFSHFPVINFVKSCFIHHNTYSYNVYDIYLKLFMGIKRKQSQLYVYVCALIGQSDTLIDIGCKYNNMNHTYQFISLPKNKISILYHYYTVSMWLCYPIQDIQVCSQLQALCKCTITAA